MDCSQEKILQDEYPFHKACRDGDLNFLDKSVNKLMKEYPSNSVLMQEDIFYGWAPIHWAAYYGQNQVLIGLIKMGVDKNLKTSEHKQTPAHLAAFGSHPDTIKVLNEANANLNAMDHLLETPLHKAVRSGNNQVVSVLLRCGVDTCIRNSSHNLAIDLATTHRHSQCYILLQNYNQQVSDALSHVDDNHQLNGVGFSYRKRFHENDSSVSTKRAKTSCEANPHFKGSHDDTVLLNENNLMNEYIKRPPSPGMDMKIPDDDLLGWCHRNGYSDSAESFPDYLFDKKPSKSNSLESKWHGVKLTGW